MDQAPQQNCLVVDLDGTLIRSDLLLESFWSLMSHAPGQALAALAQLPGSGGRARLKQRLAEGVELDVASLPYNAEILEYVSARRATGTRIALVTAADQRLADQVAAHLGLFDEVHGSDGQNNLKGAVKAAFLVERFGAGRFDYIGDAPADVQVWAQADQAITVNATAALRRQVDALGRPARHLGRGDDIWVGGQLWDWFRELRPHQWLKNVLVFLPMLAGHAFHWGAFWQSLAAFVAFSLVASSVYLMNDLLDLSSDRDHPRKKFRPLAAGDIPIGPASLLMPVLFAVGLGIALTLGPAFFALLLSYYVLTIAYSVHLKQRTIIDIWVLSVLYTTRILAGAAATGIVPSVWLMAFSIFFFFSLAAVKRQAELVDLNTRDAGDLRRRGYHRDDVLLVAMIAIAAGYVSVLVLALYIRTPFIDQLYTFPPALLGICLVLLYWISRIVMVTHRGQMHDDPLVFAVRDPVSRICLILSAGAAGFAMVLPPTP